MDQQIVNAIFIGSIYALFAVGYTLVFGILDILNLAHSAVFMLGAALTYSLVVNHGQPFWVAAIGGIVAAALMGLVIEHVCLRPLRRRQAPPISALISTIGLALVIVAAVEQGRSGTIFAWLWVDGANSVAFPAGTIPNPIWHVGDLTLEASKVVIIPISIGLMLVPSAGGFLPLVAILVGLTLGGYAALPQTAAAEAVEPRLAGAAIGYNMLFTSLGTTLGPSVFGAVIERAGYVAAWWLSAAIMIAGAALFHISARLGALKKASA